MLWFRRTTVPKNHVAVPKKKVRVTCPLPNKKITRRRNTQIANLAGKFWAAVLTVKTWLWECLISRFNGRPQARKYRPRYCITGMLMIPNYCFVDQKVKSGVPFATYGAVNSATIMAW